jgi:feruloyl-CoA synthase
MDDTVVSARDMAAVFCSDALRQLIQPRLAAMAEHATSSSTRVARALVLATPPSMSDGELTAKGTINARKVLTLRKELLERLYDNNDRAVVRL